jgi:hypothetical protein
VHNLVIQRGELYDELATARHRASGLPGSVGRFEQDIPSGRLRAGVAAAPSARLASSWPQSLVGGPSYPRREQLGLAQPDRQGPSSASVRWSGSSAVGPGQNAESEHHPAVLSWPNGPAARPAALPSRSAPSVCGLYAQACPSSATGGHRWLVVGDPPATVTSCCRSWRPLRFEAILLGLTAAGEPSAPRALLSGLIAHVRAGPAPCRDWEDESACCPGGG